jgi:hypothetical protein
MEAVVQKLTAVEGEYTSLSANHSDLLRSDAYKLMLSRRTTVIGDSQAKIIPALDAVKMLGEQLEAFDDMIEAAKRKKTAIDKAYFGGGQELQELWDFLNGPSISLPPQPVPLKNRTGTTSNLPVPTTVEAAVRIMNAAFDLGNKTTHEFGEIYDKVAPVLTNTEARLKPIETDAAALGVSVTELAGIRSQIDAAREEFKKEPFKQAILVINNIDSIISAAQEKVARVKLEREQFAQTVQTAKAELPELEKLATSVTENAAEAVDALVNPPAPARSEASVERLKVWLEKIETMIATDIVTAMTSFTNWTNTRTRYEQTESAANEQFRRALSVRKELKIRLRGYIESASKHRYEGINLLEIDDLSTLGRNAEQALQRPCDLTVATSLVNRYRDLSHDLERRSAAEQRHS